VGAIKVVQEGVNWIAFYDNNSDSESSPEQRKIRCLVHTVHSQRLERSANPPQKYMGVRDIHPFLVYVIRGTMSNDS
jgi:hypothetical protein